MSGGMFVAGFEWDDANWPKCGKHGVSREEIEHALSNDPSVFPDTEHSSDEERWKSIGTNNDGRYLFINFTMRFRAGRDILIRPISARYMHRKEILRYGRSN